MTDDEDLKAQYSGDDDCFSPAESMPTKMILKSFLAKAKECPLDEHPYTTMLKRRKGMGVEGWDERHKAAAVSAIAEWSAENVGKSVACIIKEIMTVCALADDSYDESLKDAGKELSESLNFIIGVTKCFFESIDFEHLGLKLFEQGETMTREREEEEAAALRAKAKVQRVS